MGSQTLRPSTSGRRTGTVSLWAPAEALLSCLELITCEVTATFFLLRRSKRGVHDSRARCEKLVLLGGQSWEVE